MIEQAPSSQPISSEEAAFAAALSQSITFDESFARAKDLESTVNEFARVHFDREEIMEYNSKLISEELDPRYGHFGKAISVTGNVHFMSFDHQKVDLALISDASAGEQKPEIPSDATKLEQEWKSMVAHSLGFFALRREQVENLSSDDPSLEDNPFAIYLVAKTPLTRVAYHDVYGELQVSNRLIIPTDGSVDVELIEQPAKSGRDLLEAYIGQDVLDEIKSAIHGAETFTDALHSLGKIDLSQYKYLFDSQKVDDAADIVGALTVFIQNEVREGLGINFSKYHLYQFGGAESVQYYDRDNNTYPTTQLDENMIYTGDINSISLDTDDYRLKLVAIMYMDDGLAHHVLYTLDEKIVVVPVQGIPLPKAK